MNVAAAIATGAGVAQWDSFQEVQLETKRQTRPSAASSRWIPTDDTISMPSPVMKPSQSISQIPRNIPVRSNKHMSARSNSTLPHSKPKQFVKMSSVTQT